MINYVNVEVRKSEVAILQVTVPPWELPVLEIVNGEDRCVAGGTTEARRELPEASYEYTRLDMKYKSNGDGQSYVSMVYGVGSIGVDRLQKEIEKARMIEGQDDSVHSTDEIDDPTAELFRDAPVMAAGARAIEQ